MKTCFKLFFIGLFYFCACTESENFQDELTNDFKTIDDYYVLGDIHNEYMLNTALNFDDSKIWSNEESLNYIKDFHIDFEPSNSLISSDLRIALSHQNFEWNLLNHEMLKTSLDSKILRDGLIDLKNSETIDKWEYDLVLDFLNFSQSNPSFPELEEYLSKRISEWELKYAKSNDGVFSGAFLAISMKSTEWWMGNTSYSILNDHLKVAPWLAADAVGAIVGGVLVQVGSGEMDGRNLSDRSVITGMVAGAVLGSTGIVGKAGKWISRIF